MVAPRKVSLISCLVHILITLFVNVLSTSVDGSLPATQSSGDAIPSSTPDEKDPSQYCPSNVECFKLGGRCVDWNNTNNACVYGKQYVTECTAKEDVNCTGARTFECPYICRYCYQLDEWQYRCNASACAINTPRKTWPARPFYTALCSVRDDIMCLGNRDFYKQQDCNWTSGYKWSTALILSITLGGFGADRFYLGLWREGIGKLFSFGGLGVWTLVDVILIAVGYVGPADGSLYI